MDTEPNAAVAGGETLSFAQIGRAGPFIGLAFKILLLNILTLTIYRFWGRSEVRRALWSTTTINGEPLDYSGTGLELFLGFLFAALFVLLPLFGAFYAAQFFFSVPSVEYGLSVFLLEVILIYLVAFGLYRAWRYRLSRTSWRGVRFSLAGNGHAYARSFFGWLLLGIVTLGLIGPVADMRLTGRILRDMRFGDRPFTFEGKASALYPAFLLAYVLGIVVYVGTIGVAFAYLIRAGLWDPEGTPSPSDIQAMGSVILLAVLAATLLLALTTSLYAARRLKVIGGGLRLEGVTFALDATFPSYFGLVVTNLLLVGLTLGFAMPVAELRVFRYLFSRLRAEGDIDLTQIVQSSADQPKTGEGLAEAFGFGTW